MDVKVPLPDFFIPGGPRCGTTAMSAWLSQHPRICFSRPKETFFFSTPAWEAEDEEVWRAQYARFFQHWTPEHQLVGEGTIGYLYDEQALERILKVRPDARFVVMVRNPLDMVRSFHQRLLFLLEEDESDFERAWRLQEERRAGRRLPPLATDPRILLYGEVGRLGAQLERLLAKVPREAVHVVVFDDFRRDPGAAYRGVLRFLGVEDDGRTEFRARQAGQHYRFRWLQRLMLRPPGVRMTVRQERMRRAAQKAKRHRNRHKPKPWTKRLEKRIRTWNRLPDERAPLSPELREELRAHFAPDVALLGRLLGRDLSHWVA